ncbi:hypothetical protein OTU49_003909 [Cherax quadricarinatus]|nr:uncharacterized protein LOC128696330 isoform X2 [Cherax quadricarinatus]XP_053643510.1 uncharacterized protein LOC128696330 isoform X2 [Cherax quadricarinatus]XP_053643511.1 uncharacterized protein LOC128696330 isoform X2 [Cherax quadricarinatus]
MMEQEALATPPLQRRIPPRPRKRRAASLLFPTGSEFVAEFLFTIPIQAPSGMSIPVILDVPYKFALPNITDDKDPFLWGLPRADDRHTFYGLIETVFDKFGINGKECLLRAVCEGSQSSILGIGILGEVITALLTMSRLGKRALRVCGVLVVAMAVLAAAELTETWFEYRARTKRELKKKAHTSLDTNMELGELHSRQKRTIAFPTGSTFTLTPVLCIPVVNIGDLTAFLDIELPFTIRLPNVTQVSYAGRMDDDRLGIYTVLIDTLSRFGVDGKSCLLRAVCEVAEAPLRDDGLLGEILNIILTASYGSSSSQMYDYVNAEYYGRVYGDCWSAYPQCPMSIFKMFDEINEV